MLGSVLAATKYITGQMKFVWKNKRWIKPSGLYNHLTQTWLRFHKRYKIWFTRLGFTALQANYRKLFHKKLYIKDQRCCSKIPIFFVSLKEADQKADQRKGLRLKRGLYFFNKPTSLPVPFPYPHPNAQTPRINLPIYRFDKKLLSHLN